MLTYRNLQECLIAFFTEAQPDIQVEAGKHDMFPTKTPTIWIYMRPYDSFKQNADSQIAVRYCKVSIFCFISGERNPNDAQLEAVELAEKIEADCLDLSDYLTFSDKNSNPIATQVLFDNPNPIGFDGYYANAAVSYVELLIPYIPIGFPNG